MKRLISIVCIDRGYAFELRYYYDIDLKVSVQKRILKKEKAETESVTKDYPVADFYEREIHELFGITFINGSNELLFLDEAETKTPLTKGVNKNA